MRRRRNRELAKIHIAAVKLGLDDDAYRDVLMKLTGKRSAAGLDAAGRRRVLDYFKSCGFDDSRRARRAGSVAAKVVGGLGPPGRHPPATSRASPGGSPGDPVARVKRDLVVKPGQKAQEALLEALWRELIALGAMRTGAFARLDTFVKKRWGVSHPRFMTPEQASEAIEALKDWLRREHRRRRRHG